MKLLILTRYTRLGASSRVRILQYVPCLESGGIEVEVYPLLGDSYINDIQLGRRKSITELTAAYLKRLIQVFKVKKFDLIWIEKELFPMFPAWAESILKGLGVRYVVDYDDAIFHNYDRSKNPAVRFLLGGKIDSVMRNSAIVIAGNEYLADRAKNVGAKRVEILPSVIDLNKYRYSPSRAADSSFTIGWIGSASTTVFLKSIENALNSVYNAGGSRFVLVGAGNFEMQNIPFIKNDWTEDTEVDEIMGFDAGVMPLIDTPFANGKCGYKIIQYMACGKPAVASPVGVNKKIIDHGETGFLASGEGEWIECLSTLRDNPELSEKMGEKARAKVEKQYCLQATAPVLLSILESLL